MTNEKIATAPDQSAPKPGETVAPKPVVEPVTPATIVAPAKAGA